jgi:hypothetical protein
MTFRKIRVAIGDVFAPGAAFEYPVVVEQIDALRFRATVRNSDTGRRTNIQVSRLQREYYRCGEINAAAAHRALEQMDREAEKGRKR